MAPRTPLLLAALAALLACASAHGGAFHETTPETNHHIRAKVAFCNKFVPFAAADFKKAKPLAGTAVEKAPAFKGAAPAGITINGNGTVWQYLYKNLTCNLSGGIQLHAVLTQNGKPLAGFNVTGRTHTAKCAEGAGSRFYFDPKGNLTDPYNPLFWYAGQTNKTGAALGNGANDGKINLASPNAPRSLVVYDDKSGAPFACCDLAPQGPLNTDWVKKLEATPGAKKCAQEEADGGHSAHGRRLLL
ncbi:hypothetical protein Rsub_03826 [Raphidocelis subcapitata]|uniref:Uncharacterized protein n=1 Tax=Raphidocelis subcapitata TaxID=307507 RepID=A0A2V0NTK2_9CHLO|nr:hypothetical protein Rsub_03826 [Raphidocelis subcapitata]|eukprot:GBF90971.1 hypothetical protein Rsub_03826 [Raphidocelis subcapitata]